MPRGAEASRRLEAAERLVARAEAPILSAAVVGSVSTGFADRDSDIELELFVEELPTEAEREDLAARLGGLRVVHYPAPLRDGSVWTVCDSPEGWLELGWQVEEKAIAALGELRRGAVLDHELLVLASAYGQAAWLRRSEAMGAAIVGLGAPSEELRAAIAAEVLRQWDNELAWKVRATLVRRGDRLPLAQRHVADAQRMLRILFALNGRWEGDYKWIKEQAEGLPRKPSDFAARLDLVLAAPDGVSANAALAGLLDELLALLPVRLAEPGLVARIRGHSGALEG
ncbi:MAG TPA: hypothetical protein P5165_07960 [Spirochaetia bacterium]|nr:hypothetical protein [Spirochaetia bacterium]